MKIFIFALLFSLTTMTFSARAQEDRYPIDFTRPMYNISLNQTCDDIASGKYFKPECQYPQVRNNNMFGVQHFIYMDQGVIMPGYSVRHFGGGWRLNAGGGWMHMHRGKNFRW